MTFYKINQGHVQLTSHALSKRAVCIQRFRFYSPAVFASIQYIGQKLALRLQRFNSHQDYLRNTFKSGTQIIFFKEQLSVTVLVSGFHFLIVSNSYEARKYIGKPFYFFFIYSPSACHKNLYPYTICTINLWHECVPMQQIISTICPCLYSVLFHVDQLKF